MVDESEESPMRTIAFDLGTMMGYAFNEGDFFEFGSFSISHVKKESKQMRWLRLWNWLHRLADKYEPLDVVVIERPGNLFGHARKVIPGIQTVIELWSVYLGVDFHEVGPTEVKRFATGKGKATKLEMIKAAQTLWPDAVFAVHDEADAMHILRCHLEKEK